MFASDTRTTNLETRESWLMSNTAALFTSHREVAKKMPRVEGSTARTDARTAEEWTGECLFDCYND